MRAATATTRTAAVLVLATAHLARAAGVVGTGTAGSCNDAALDAALGGGGSVTFNCGAAPLAIDISTGTGTKVIAADSTIDGGGLITISGGGTIGVFLVNRGVTLAVQNLTIANGQSAPGGGIFNVGTVTISKSIFTGNTTPSGGANCGGGGIYNVGTVSITNSTFTGNSASGGAGNCFGGGIENVYGTVTITNSTFTGNTASSAGGGIDNYNGTVSITDSTFTGNSAPGGNGGGIENVYGTVSITNSTFTSNSAAQGGGFFNGGTVTINSWATITNSTFTGNTATGGGIFNVGTVRITNTIVANNSSGNCVGLAITDEGHNLDDGTTCGFNSAKGSLNGTDPKLDPADLNNNGGPTPSVALCTAVGAPAGCAGASPAIDAGDQTVCAAAPVNSRDQRGFVRPGIGHAHCSIGAYEADATAPSVCIGDCDGSGNLTVAELIMLVNIALGTARPSACPENIPISATVDVTLILQAVNNALNGCPSTDLHSNVVR